MTDGIDPNDPEILDRNKYDVISPEDIQEFKASVNHLIGVQLPILKIPKEVLITFEPSQVGTINGTLLDASIPNLAEIIPENDLLENIGLKKHAGILGDREGYPDFLHDSGVRAELKLLYVDPENIEMKSPPTAREASARLTQKVTLKNIVPSRDVLMVIAYQLQPNDDKPELISPTIIDIGVFPMLDCILARDKRLIDGGGKWFGQFETPAILSKVGKDKLDQGKKLDESTYGRKASENKDYNEDTNFGKLKRVPYRPLQKFLKKHGATFTRRGDYPNDWRLD